MSLLMRNGAMATLRNTITFRCKKCKTNGSAEISETDHPYNPTATYVSDVTLGFSVRRAAYPDTAEVYCETCNKKVR
ncbi:hypothetical protein Sbs19_26290 [Sphingobium sp. BS19]|nr:hypothetical protein Sbs19_26290 [Sphingobium sp. BS19]